jgi:hypothetical protein
MISLSHDVLTYIWDSLTWHHAQLAIIVIIGWELARFTHNTIERWLS